MKKWVKIILCVLLALLLLAGGYVAYVFIDYHRIGDQMLTPVQSTDAARSVDTNTAYTVVSWNIGFGAYEDDYGFFMDGGTESRAWSKERLTANMDAIAGYLKQQNADFCLLQEVDIGSTRTYHVDEREPLYAALFNKSSVFCQNYDSPYLLYPLTAPHGASRSGLLTFSPANITAADRVELPVESGFMKLLDLDRCYSVSRIPVDNGKELVIFNLHMSAYGNSDSIRQGQIEMLCNDMAKEYEAGNYVLCGGDFNHDLKASEEDTESCESWAFPFPRTELPEHFAFCLDLLSSEEQAALWNSARNADMEYVPGVTYTVTLDGFIISDNIECLSYENVNTGYSYSDHDPVKVEFMLK